MIPLLVGLSQKWVNGRCCPWLQRANPHQAKAPPPAQETGGTLHCSLTGGAGRINTVVTSQNTCFNVPPAQRRSTTALATNDAAPEGQSIGKTRDTHDNDDDYSGTPTISTTLTTTPTSTT